MLLAVTHLVLGLSILHPAATPLPVMPAGAGVVLNEFVAGPARDWDGSGAFSSRDDEWVEVYNTGPEPAEMSSYLLTDAERLPRFVFGGVLAPGARLVVFGKDSYDWERAHGFPAYGFSLSNSGDTVMLWKVTGADTTLVDSYAYRSHEAAADRAVGRRADGTEWVLLDGLDPYSGTTPPAGTGCMPSPGLPNVCGDTPTLQATWSRLKALYH